MRSWHSREARIADCEEPMSAEPSSERCTPSFTTNAAPLTRLAGSSFETVRMTLRTSETFEASSAEMATRARYARVVSVSSSVEPP